MPLIQPRFGRTGIVHYAIGRAMAWLLGWRIIGPLPPDPKLLGIFAPHTSNWDLVLMLTFAANLRIRTNWLVKDNVYRWPLRSLIRWIGGVPVDRGSRSRVVDQVAEAYAASEGLYLAIAPEGTRGKTTQWKTGFYHIAVKAGVRIVMLYADYEKREVGVGPVFTPSGDIHEDFKLIRAFYSKVTPRHPKKTGEIVLGDS